MNEAALHMVALMLIEVLRSQLAIGFPSGVGACDTASRLIVLSFEGYLGPAMWTRH